VIRVGEESAVDMVRAHSRTIGTRDCSQVRALTDRPVIVLTIRGYKAVDRGPQSR